MTKKNLKKFTLSLKPSDKIEYTLSPEPVSTKTDNLVVTHEFDVDINQPSQIHVHVTTCPEGEQLIVEEIQLNHTPITQLNAVSFFRTDFGEIRKNHGYIDTTGTFLIKLHTNAISLNFLTYLLSLTK